MTQLTDLDYDTIKNAVMETARGRWFLSEHKKRNEQADTPDLMEAIKRLEKIAVSIGNDIAPQVNASQVNTDQVKTEARPVIAEVVPMPAAIIEPQPEPQNEIGQNTPPQNDAPQDNTQLNEENSQFFANDEDLFADDANVLLTSTTDTASTTDTVSMLESDSDSDRKSDIEKIAVSFKSVPNKTVKPDSERIKVFKMENTVAENDSPPSENTPETVPTFNVPDPVLEATEEEKDRIVIIRNSDKNDIDIPLAADFAQELENLSAKKF